MADPSNSMWKIVLLTLQRSHVLLKRKSRAYSKVCMRSQRRRSANAFSGVIEVLRLASLYAAIVLCVLIVDNI